MISSNEKNLDRNRRGWLSSSQEHNKRCTSIVECKANSYTVSVHTYVFLVGLQHSICFLGRQENVDITLRSFSNIFYITERLLGFMKFWKAPSGLIVYCICYLSERQLLELGGLFAENVMLSDHKVTDTRLMSSSVFGKSCRIDPSETLPWSFVTNLSLKASGIPVYRVNFYRSD